MLIYAACWVELFVRGGWLFAGVDWLWNCVWFAMWLCFVGFDVAVCEFVGAIVGFCLLWSCELRFECFAGSLILMPNACDWVWLFAGV